jgi:putative methylase
MKRSELTRRLDGLAGFTGAKADLEQVATPAEEASELLFEALGRGDLFERSVLDLGTGTGRLAIGAAILGAHPVVGVDQDEGALTVARENGARSGVEVRWELRKLDEGPLGLSADTVVMNPPFGAQKAHADRPFLQAALEALGSEPGRAVYLFANAASQAFIQRWSIASRLRIEEHRRSSWPLPPTFPHHREARKRIEVDRWILRTEGNHP